MKRDRARSIAEGLLAFVVLGLGWLFDRSLLERQAIAEASAYAEARETAHLGAMTLRASIARIELSVVAGTPPNGVAVTTLRPVVSPRVSRGPVISFRERASPELIELLASERQSPNGIPEAVLAALALVERGSPNADLRVDEVGAKLLRGELPVSARDLPELAHRLGVGSDAAVMRLRRELLEAPPPEVLPPFPAFLRSLGGERIDGWSVQGSRVVHYSTALQDLLRDAHLPVQVRVVGGLEEAGAAARVPDVPGLAVAVDPESPDTANVRFLRIGLWIVLFVTVGALLVYKRALAREARALGREKQFLSNVTHELKTPLAALRLLGESLETRRGDPVEYGALISRETTRLQDLVDRVLTATRLDEAPSLSRVSPNAIAESVVSLLSTRARSRSVELRAELDSVEAPEAVWDGDAVHRALVNLVENAIEHGGTGGACSLRMEILPDAVRFVVADRGPGIGPRDRKRVFERFARGDTESAGTGLGLHVVERVAEAHGGRVDLETSPGEGCRFYLTLPLVPEAAGRAR